MSTLKTLSLLSIAGLALALTTPAIADNHDSKDGRHKHHKGKMFEKIDSDGDGVVTESEFLNAHKERFNSIDSDGDGKISKDEAKSHHDTRRAKMKDRIKERREKRQERSSDTASDE